MYSRTICRVYIYKPFVFMIYIYDVYKPFISIIYMCIYIDIYVYIYTCIQTYIATYVSMTYIYMYTYRQIEIYYSHHSHICSIKIRLTSVRRVTSRTRSRQRRNSAYTSNNYDMYIYVPSGKLTQLWKITIFDRYINNKWTIFNNQLC